jgi:phosphotransferase system enzyme I (PtsP)
LPIILDRAIEIVMGTMRADACAIFLLDPGDGQLRLRATTGLARGLIDRISVAPEGGILGEVLTSIRPRFAADIAVATSREQELFGHQFRSWLCVPLTLRNRAIGVLSVQSVHPRHYSARETEELAVGAALLGELVAVAQLVDSLDSRQLARLPARPPAGGCQARMDAGEATLRGNDASPGIAIGAAVLRCLAAALPAELTTASLGADLELERVRDAFSKTRNDVLQVQKATAYELDDEQAFIFSAHLLLLGDPVLHERIQQALATGRTAPQAVNDALMEFIVQLQGVADPYVQERVEDIHDLRSRVLSHLRGSPRTAAIERQIVVSRRISPSLVVELKTRGALALVTETGGTASHGAILARSLGIPTVTGVTGACSAIRAGDQLIVDATQGIVIASPGEATRARYEAALRRSEQKRTEFARYRDRPAQTADHARVILQANVGFPADLATARHNGAEGIGLYRTELSFIAGARFLTIDEQVRLYKKAYEALPGLPINFRLLDLGADKFIPGQMQEVSRSAFHGQRGIRLLFDYPHVLRDQVQAFALAAADRPLRILIPMVSSLEELRRTAGLVREAIAAIPAEQSAQRAPELGVMIETPGAVELAGHLAAAADFLCIGTNDLIQYTLVIDREDPRLASRTDCYHPAISRMIRRTVVAAQAAGKRVTVCGEMAARSGPALLLLALGVDGLSIPADAIPQMKKMLADNTVGNLRDQLEQILASPDAESIRATVAACMAPDTA